MTSTPPSPPGSPSGNGPGGFVPSAASQISRKGTGVIASSPWSPPGNPTDSGNGPAGGFVPPEAAQLTRKGTSFVGATLTPSLDDRKSIFNTIMSQPPLTSENYSHKEALHRPVTVKDADNNMSLGNLTRKSLPYFQPWYATSGPNELPPDFGWISSSCGGKAAIGVFGGGLMGLLMGVFLGAMSDAQPPVTVINGKDVPEPPMKEQLRVTARATAQKSMYWCRNFAFITGVFGGSECLVEKYRGKHDVWNSVFSGCITGAAIQAKQGPQAAAMGCGGFAAFSLVIDSFMGHY